MKNYVRNFIVASALVFSATVASAGQFAYTRTVASNTDRAAKIVVGRFVVTTPTGEGQASYDEQLKTVGAVDEMTQAATKRLLAKYFNAIGQHSFGIDIINDVNVPKPYYDARNRVVVK